LSAETELRAAQSTNVASSAFHGTPLKMAGPALVSGMR
jgi:hypothetical protein